MITRHAWLLALAIPALAVLVVALGSSHVDTSHRAAADAETSELEMSERETSEAETRELPPAPPATMPDHVRWIALGGGATPELNQVSLEEDLLDASRALGAGGVVLFAGGPGTRSVQVATALERGDPLLLALGELFAPRAGRDARYAPARLSSHGPATLDRFYAALEGALADGDEPLLVYVAAHGDRGELPHDSSVLLWAGDELDPVSFAEALDERRSARRLRVVMTSCYAGGFAELAFRGADETLGPTDADRCGLFATAWDAEASGCDPSPERAAHESWARHFLAALEGHDTRGVDRRAAIDLDGDGAIGLLEAHAYARSSATSFDLPTTTSTRLLRALVGRDREGARRPYALPEEESVLRVIGARLGIEGEGDVQARLDRLVTRRVELEAAMEARADEGDAAWFSLSGELLSRWPVLDDPYHPDFPRVLETEGDAIAQHLERSPLYLAWLEAQEDLDAMSDTHAALQVEEAPLRRWLEAHETLDLASRLAAVGGEGLARWERMRACELAPP